MKVIFLDFDGVLNREADGGSYGVTLLPEKMELLTTIVEATGAEIVLSTSWREHWSVREEDCNPTGLEINRIFRGYGLHIFDKTPKLHTRREGEIKSWLETHPETETFLVLDDALLSAEFLEGHFVKTSRYFGGLNEEDVQRSVAILTSPRKHGAK